MSMCQMRGIVSFAARLPTEVAPIVRTVNTVTVTETSVSGVDLQQREVVLTVHMESTKNDYNRPGAASYPRPYQGDSNAC